MKGKVIAFFCIFLFLIVIILVINRSPKKYTVQTFKQYSEINLSKKVVFLNSLIIRASSDDFIEGIEKEKGDLVDVGTCLLTMESKEESYQLAKAKNEYAMSLLNDGKAIQEEKRQAVALAMNKLDNTTVRSPVKGYIFKIPVNERLFVSKGTPLFEILPADSKAYFKVSLEEEALLKTADFVEVYLKPTGEKWLMNEIQIVEENSDRYCFLSDNLDEIKHEFLDALYCDLIITSSVGNASWIPAEFADDQFVLLEGKGKHAISILEKNNDLLLVQGLNNGDILIKKR